MKIYIKHLPKDVLLYELWKAARNSPNFYYCKDKRPTLDLETCTNDINHMINNKRTIDLTTYYGRLLYIDITNDYFEDSTYNAYNGDGSAQKIIDALKERELKHTICVYFKFF